MFFCSFSALKVQEEDSYEAKLMVRATTALNCCNSAVIFRGIKGNTVRGSDNPSYWNAQEVFQVFTYVQQLLNADIKREDIGVITPYQKQVRLCFNCVVLAVHRSNYTVCLFYYA